MCFGDQRLWPFPFSTTSHPESSKCVHVFRGWPTLGPVIEGDMLRNAIIVCYHAVIEDVMSLTMETIT